MADRASTRAAAAPQRAPLVLVDGSSYLYRAFHALPSFTDSRGEPTGAIYGMTAMLRKLLADYQPEHVAVVFDAKGRTFRDDLYAEYKANRAPMPEELASQVEPIREIVAALGISLIEVPGVEADDVIGTLVTEAERAGLDALVSTGDKDLAQLVDDRVTLVNTMTGTVLDREGVERKFGVPPELIVDLFALIGDSIDNIPGVPGVGPKTAARLIASYDSLEGVIAHAGEVKGKIGERLRAALADLPRSRELLTIRRDVPLELGPLDLERREPDRERLRELFARFEFKSWLGELLEERSHGAADEAPAATLGELHYETVLSEEALAAWVARLREAGRFAFDSETTSLDYMRAEPVGFSFAIEPGVAAYVPFGHDYPGAPAQLPRATVLAALAPLLGDERCEKIGQNLKYDLTVLANAGVELRGVRFDTMLESYVLDSTATRHDMDSLALKYLHHRTIRFEDVAGKGAKQLAFNEVSLEPAAHYAAEDADVALRLHAKLWPKLEAEAPLRHLFETVEMPLVPVLSRMERAGVRIDADMLRAQSLELAERLRELEARAHELAGGPFNLGSPRQIQDILFGRLKLPVRSKTPKGQPSTSEAVLQELAFEFELPRVILDHRALAKLKSTYTDALPARVNPQTGRVHTSYHQAVASTGRLSSSEPNLQNIPVRTAEGRRIRQAFVAAPGYRLIAADYSQIELRIMAHLSGDEGLRRAFAEGADIHRATAAEVFATPTEQVSPEQRRSAKAINFGLIYGMSAFGLGRQLGIPREEAQAYVDLYFARYPGVKAFMERTREQARERGYVQTLFGRRLYVPEIASRNAQRRQYAERTAINAPMQGSAADIIKRAMVRLDEWLSASGVDVRMIMQVHDELVFEAREDEVRGACEVARSYMSSAAELAVSLAVDIGIGENWDSAHG